MLYKLFLEKKKKDAIAKKKNNLVFIFTTSFVILLGAFGIFISHYNGDKFNGEIRTNNIITTSTDLTEKVIDEVNNKTIADTLDEPINPSTINTKPLIMMFDLNSASTTNSPTNSQAAITIIDIFQVNSDIFKIDYSIDRAKQSQSTQK